jgi:hypothetical protein
MALSQDLHLEDVMTRICRNLLTSALVLGHLPIALASTTLYVNGASGSDTNDCVSVQTACKTIGHAISVASSGDSIIVAAATYTEHLTIGVSLNLSGAGVGKTIIDGGSTGTVVTVSSAHALVTISNVTIRNGRAINGGGVTSNGALTISHSLIWRNEAYSSSFSAFGGGVLILSGGTLTLNSSTVSGNSAFGRVDAWGGGISSFGIVRINRSTVSGNTAGCGTIGCHAGGGGINNGGGTLTINNSTVAGNHVYAAIAYNEGGGILSSGVLWISNSTISGNSARQGGGIYGHGNLQNTLVADNSALNCYGYMSAIFSLSSDNSCNLTGPGDKNNTNPKLGTLGYHGGPTQTIPLLSGSPAIDAGDPSGCIDSQGHRLTTDQRGLPRPDKEDTGGCDMGAYESQGD